MGQFEARFFYPSYRKRKNVTNLQHGAVCGASLNKQLSNFEFVKGRLSPVCAYIWSML